ncbi:MAG TPA: hypothetical protein GX725_01220 [Mollicutes bacterium]|jgi:hypothetical protein|nr:hypothetical protein [Mollicutes bacterium]
MNNRKEQLTVIAITIIALTSCLFLLFKAIKTLQYHGVRPEDIIYTNDIKSDINYLVYLKPNVFFERTI